jgi:O-methyltransferase
MIGQPASLIDNRSLNWLRTTAQFMPPGDFIEVGVYRGGSAWHLAEVAREQERCLYLCDTFCGIPYQSPEHGDMHKIGDFGDTSLVQVMECIPDAEYIVGVFPESAGSRLEGARFALAHIDADQYRSVSDAIETLVPLMVSGGIMIFDDYHYLPGAKKAIDEHFNGSLCKNAIRPYMRF